jgi:hypothetical protein
MNNISRLNNFFLITDEGIIVDQLCIQEYCITQKLFKSLSLSIFNYNNTINCPTSILITTKNKQIVSDFCMKFQFPLLIRIDYAALPEKKFLGGIEINSLESLLEVNEYIISNKCFTLLQSNFSRFNNDLNIGVLYIRNNKNVVIEYLGKGFDASDLRLGKINPHEIKNYNLDSYHINQIYLCSRKEYQESRIARIQNIKKLASYQKHVNNYRTLLSNIESIGFSDNIFRKITLPPKEYKATNKFIEKKIIRFIHAFAYLQNKLPHSNSYVASLSINNNKLLLWDIYGQWYKR